MVTPEILAFIQDQDAKGVSRETTRITLATQGGWTYENIDEAFAKLPRIYAAPTSGTPNPPPAVIITDYPKVHPGNPLAPLMAVFVFFAVLLGAAGIAYALVPEVRYEAQYLFASPTERVLLSLTKLQTIPQGYDVEFSSEMYNELEDEDQKPDKYQATVLAKRSALQMTSTIENTRTLTNALPMRALSSFTVVTNGVGKNVALSGESYADDTSLMVKLNDKVDLLFFSTEPVTGKWISLLSEEGVRSPIGGETVSSVSKGYTAYRETLAYLLEHAPEYLSARDTGDVRTVLGERARKYHVTIDSIALALLVKSSPLFTSGELSDEEKEQLNESLIRYAEGAVEAAPMEFWISEWRHFPVKWRSVSRVKEDSFGASYIAVTETKGAVTIPKAPAPVEPPPLDLTASEAFRMMLGS